MRQNIPVDMIFYCDTLGKIKPLRIRLETEEHEMVTTDIKEILYRKETRPSGINILVYGCKVMWNNEEHIVELNYNIEAHKWTLFRIIQ